ncbi:MAG: hypothetical protein EZS28_025668, partial [Streblomastix strix]
HYLYNVGVCGESDLDGDLFGVYGNNGRLVVLLLVLSLFRAVRGGGGA